MAEDLSGYPVERLCSIDVTFNTQSSLSEALTSPSGAHLFAVLYIFFCLDDKQDNQPFEILCILSELEDTQKWIQIGINRVDKYLRLEDLQAAAHIKDRAVAR